MTFVFPFFSFFCAPYLTVALMLQCCVCLFVCQYVCNVGLCIVAKRCILEQKLLFTSYSKSYRPMRNRLISKWMHWPLFRGRLGSCQPLRHIRHWVSRKPLEIEAWFQRTTNRKNLRKIEWSRDRWRHVWGQSRDPNGMDGLNFN